MSSFFTSPFHCKSTSVAEKRMTSFPLCLCSESKRGQCHWFLSCEWAGQECVSTHGGNPLPFGTPKAGRNRGFSVSSLSAIIPAHKPAIPTWVKADLEDTVGKESLCSSAMISSILHSFLWEVSISSILFQHKWHSSLTREEHVNVGTSPTILLF